MQNKKEILKELQRIPGVVKSIADDLWNLGIRSIADLQHQNPEFLYKKLCALSGQHVDRCMLYVFRCAIYFASTPKPTSPSLDQLAKNLTQLQGKLSNLNQALGSL